MVNELARIFIEAYDGAVADADALGLELADAVATARGAWPELAVDEAAWVRALAAIAPAPLAATRPLADLVLADLYLAFACAQGEPRAVAACDAVLVREAGFAAGAARVHDSVRDEAIQITRELVFADRPQRPPAIRDYGGRGTLQGWLRVIVSREVVRLARAQDRTAALEDHLLDVPVADADPVLEQLKTRYRDELAAAFRAALDELPRRDRTLLRYQLVDGLTIDQIGALKRVHRATAARWLAQIRDHLLERTHELLAESLAIDSSEASSIVRLVQSQLEVSVIRHLRPNRG